MKYEVQLGCLVYICGLLLFYQGFLPSQKAVFTKKDEVTANEDSTNKNGLEARYSHLVLVVIDAMRANFIFEDNNWSESMPFLREALLNGTTYSFETIVHPPTVTMPRIKALVSGTVPSFSEVLFNTASREIGHDNLLSRLRTSGKQAVFYGDDTWLKLFPRHFLRSDGTQSFYVADYTEVDDNVTRHIEEEMGRSDWNLMVLHYLGVDHIGHLAGPSSPLLPRKLKEMDAVIKQLVHGLTKRDNTRGTRSVVAVCGDHGMSETGSHGGATSLEVTTPFILIDTQNKGWRKIVKDFQQTDIAATLSALLGLPIPSQSIGRPSPLLFTATQRNTVQHMAACHYTHSNNLPQHLQTKLTLVCSRANNFTLAYVDVIIEQAAQHLLSRLANYHVPYMVLGLVLMFSATLCLLRNVFEQFHRISLQSFCLDRVAFFQLAALTMPILAPLSTSLIEEEHYIWYFFTTTSLILMVFEETRRKLLKSQKVTMNGSVAILLLLRVTVAWKRTGVKWIELDDLSKLMQRHELVSWLVFWLSVAVVMLVASYTETWSGRLLIVFSVCLLTASRNLNLLGTVRCEQLVYFCALACLLLKRIKINSVLVLLLLTRNIPWLCCLMLLEVALTTFLKRYETLKEWQLFYVFFAESKLAFFSQGNSNSFATVDISAGMTALYEYDDVLSNLQTYLATYAGQLFFILSYFQYSGKSARDSNNPLRYLLLYHFIEGTVLCACVFLQRNHLFIWSVFAPRFFYQALHTISALIWTLSFSIYKRIF